MLTTGIQRHEGSHTSLLVPNKYRESSVLLTASIGLLPVLFLELSDTTPTPRDITDVAQERCKIHPSPSFPSYRSVESRAAASM